MEKLEKRCTFCGMPATTREHVFSKCFFDKPYPHNMLTVPSCMACNNGYSIDEQYLMYLIDYLKSIEINDGDFTRKKVQKTFQHNQTLEDRMIASLCLDHDYVSFRIESKRVDRVVCKIAQCLYFFCYGSILASNQIEVRWSFESQMNKERKEAIEAICFRVLQEGNVKYYCTVEEIGFCLDDFFYACVTITGV